MPFYRLFLIAWTLCVAVVFVMPGLLLHDDDVDRRLISL